MLFPPAFAHAFAAPSRHNKPVPERFADRLTFRRGERFPRRDDAPEPSAPTETPLTPTERALYIGFAGWVGLTFLSLFLLILFMHSPGNAN